jgi:hypothetical protein
MTIAATLTIVLFVVAGILWWVTKRKPRLEVSVVAPEFVAEGHSCEVRVMIVNASNQVVVLDFLTVDDSLLSHFDLIALTPNAQSATMALGGQGWRYRRSLRPSESFDVVAHLRAKYCGDAVGELGAVDSRLVWAKQKMKIHAGVAS